MKSNLLNFMLLRNLGDFGDLGDFDFDNFDNLKGSNLIIEIIGCIEDFVFEVIEHIACNKH